MRGSIANGLVVLAVLSISEQGSKLKEVGAV
jgi:hypothetical protein